MTDKDKRRWFATTDAHSEQTKSCAEHLRIIKRNRYSYCGNCPEGGWATRCPAWRDQLEQ